MNDVRVGVLAVVCGFLGLGCGGAPEEGENLGEQSEALATMRVSMQQGQPVKRAPVSGTGFVQTLSQNYQGTTDLTATRFQPSGTGQESVLRVSLIPGADEFPNIALLRWACTFGVLATPLLPSGATVDEVKLVLSINRASNDKYAVRIQTTQWSEEARGDYPLPVGQMVGSFTPTQTGSLEVPLSASLGNTIKAWQQDPTKNFGLAIHGTGAGLGRLELHSSESQFGPKLVVSYH